MCAVKPQLRVQYMQLHWYMKVHVASESVTSNIVILTV